MFDRTVMDDSSSPLCIPVSADEIVLRTQERMRQTAFVSLNINAEVDNDNANLLHVTVKGNRLKEDFTAHAPRISVVLYEDNIKARSQASGGDDYVHQHVSRCVNSTWGDVIEWDGDAYTYTCDLTLREDYVRGNLGVVAYVWDYDTEIPPSVKWLMPQASLGTKLPTTLQLPRWRTRRPHASTRWMVVK